MPRNLAHQFDLFCTSTHRLYFDQNCTSSCTYRPIRNPVLKKGRSTRAEVQSWNYRGRSRAVQEKYRKGWRSENGRSTEKVELMRTQFSRYSKFQCLSEISIYVEKMRLIFFTQTLIMISIMIFNHKLVQKTYFTR